MQVQLSRLRRLALIPVVAALSVLPLLTGTARGSHIVPGQATSIAVSLVNNYRQTISATQCTGRGGVSGTHRSPLAYPSCGPPAFEPGTAAALGPNSLDSNVHLTAMTSDIAVVVNLEGVICLGATPGCTGPGAPYATPPDSGGSPDADVTAIFRVRLNDHGNCFAPPTCPDPFTFPSDPTRYNQAGTMIDVDYPVPVDCDTSGNCQATTTLNAIVPGAFTSGEMNNVEVFRVRVRDSGQNGVRADVDDREFATQGLLVP